MRVKEMLDEQPIIECQLLGFYDTVWSKVLKHYSGGCYLFLLSVGCRK